MSSFGHSRMRVALISTALLASAAVHSQAHAADERSTADKLKVLEQQLEQQKAQLEEQGARLAEQQREIELLRQELVPVDDLVSIEGRGVDQADAPQTTAVLPDRPVGEAPDLPRTETQVAAVPQGQGVLTPAGRLIIDPSVEYTLASTNRLVFRGVELIPGIQFGVIEASDADRETLSGAVTLRYGLTDRLELEARVPFLRRSDDLQVVQQREGTIVREIDLDGSGIGDVEIAARYQLNRPVGQRPIFVGNLRVKSDSGRSPFEIPFDQFGVATRLATGSGFWGVQPGLNFLMPSDPAVIFGGASYLYHIPKNIDRTIGDVYVGRVDPGDAISTNLGFGFALNPRFSYSLGYRHTYVLATESEIGTTIQRSSDLQVGSLVFGMSYRIDERETLNLGFEFGVTKDAPDVSMSVRVPFVVGR